MNKNKTKTKQILNKFEKEPIEKKTHSALYRLENILKHPLTESVRCERLGATIKQWARMLSVIRKSMIITLSTFKRKSSDERSDEKSARDRRAMFE